MAIEKHGDGWRVRLTHKDGTRIYEIRMESGERIRNKTQARQRERELKVDIAKPGWTNPALGRTSFDEYAGRYMASKHDVRRSTKANIVARIANHLRPTFGHRAIADIRVSDVLEWQNAMKLKVGPDTVNSCLQTIVAILRLAEIDGAINRNEAKFVKPLRGMQRREIHPLAFDTIRRLADAIDPRFRAPVLFAGSTGLRAGELWALRVSSVDFLRRTVRVIESADDRGGFSIGPVKTERSRRTVRLDEATVELLAAHLAQYPSTDYLFTAAEGGPVRHRNFSRRAWAAAVRQCAGELPGGFTFRDVRHSHASILIDRGWRPDQVRDRLGHSSIRVTVDVYGHLFGGHDDELISDLGSLVRDALA